MYHVHVMLYHIFILESQPLGNSFDNEMLVHGHGIICITEEHLTG